MKANCRPQKVNLFCGKQPNNHEIIVTRHKTNHLQPCVSHAFDGQSGFYKISCFLKIIFSDKKKETYCKAIFGIVPLRQLRN